jgi:PAS domain S-box-containing protein
MMMAGDEHSAVHDEEGPLKQISGTWFERGLDSMDEFVLVIGDKSRLLWANPAFCDYYGLTQEQLAAIVDGEHSDPDDTVQYVRDDRHVYTTGQTLEVTEPVTRHDGVVGHYRTVKKPFFDEAGTIVGTVGVSRPARDEKEVESAEQDERERKTALSLLRSLVTEMPISVLVLDASHRILSASSRAKKTFGLSLEVGQPYGSQLADFVDIEPQVNAAFGSGTVTELKNVAVPALGLRLNVITQPWALPVGHAGGVLVTFQDITDLMVTQERLSHALEEVRASESDQNVMLDSIDTGVIVANAAGSFRLVNSAARRIVGFDANQVRPQDWFAKSGLLDVAGDPIPVDLQPHIVALAGEEYPPTVMQVRPPDGSGKIKWVSAAATPIGDKSRDAAVLTFNDVTQLIKTQQELEEFAFVASHDLREPLRMVTGFVTLLGRELGEQLSPTAQQYMDFAVDGATRMNLLIESLLAVSRTQSRVLEKTSVDLSAMAATTVSDLRTLMDDVKGSVQVAPLPTIQADQDQIARLFSNLIGNALKFGHPDRPVEVSVTASEANGSVRVAIADNGIGMAPEYSERVFGMFQKLHRPSEYGGSGIGLALCKRIVERHGGTIGVCTDRPEGTEFWFSVPMGETT